MKAYHGYIEESIVESHVNVAIKVGLARKAPRSIACCLSFIATILVGGLKITLSIFSCSVKVTVLAAIDVFADVVPLLMRSAVSLVEGSFEPDPLVVIEFCVLESQKMSHQARLNALMIISVVDVVRHHVKTRINHCNCSLNFFQVDKPLGNWITQLHTLMV